MIKTILDNDVYKFVMMYAVWKLFYNVRVRYTFFDRNNTKYPKGFAKELMAILESLNGLKLTEDEFDWVRTHFPQFERDFLGYLKSYRYNTEGIEFTQDKEGHLHGTIEGSMVTKILWEVPILSAISELYFSMHKIGKRIDVRSNAEINRRIAEKCRMFVLMGAHCSDMGTRRRFSYDMHASFVEQAVDKMGEYFTGTSNMLLAKQVGCNPIGTQAHEWPMLHAAIYGYASANERALENWVNVYRGEFGIALTDTFTTAQFLRRAFTKYHMMLWIGCRQDSGNPNIWTDRMIMAYMANNIDFRRKTYLYSDSLNTHKVGDIIIHNRPHKLEVVRFGLGTFYTHDIPDVDPLNIVIKLSSVATSVNDWTSVAKISDAQGKRTATSMDIIQKAVMDLGVHVGDYTA